MPEPGGDVRAGVDVGGSSVKLGAASRAGSILEEDALEVRDEERVGELLDRLARRLGELPGARGMLAAGLGVGVPGLIDRDAGRVLTSPNLPWLDGVELAAELAGRLDLSERAVVLENDANVAALGEQWLGAARGAENVLVLTLGTGIGGGLILDGDLFLGEGLAGGSGHVTVDPAGPRCTCGARGCLETFASASAARRRATELGLPAEAPGDLERLAERARAGAGPERSLLADVGRDLGRGIAQVVSLLDVRTFVVGGGFAAALDTLADGLRAGLLEWAYGGRVSRVRILPAQLGPSAGWIGAARLAFLRDRSFGETP